MSLLLDRILAADFEVPDVELLRSPTVVQTNNVAQYLHGTNRKDPDDLTQDFPNIAPPWPNFFVEFAMPSTICEVTPEGSQMMQWEGPKTFGLHWMAGRRGSYDFGLQQSLFKTLSESTNPQIRSKYLEAAEQAAWFGHVHLFLVVSYSRVKGNHFATLPPPVYSGTLDGRNSCGPKFEAVANSGNRTMIFII